MNVNGDFLSKWFGGKALTNAQAALVILNESLAAGYWVNRGSTKVPAAFGKFNLAAKMWDKSDVVVTYEDIGKPVYVARNVFTYGGFMKLEGLNLDGLPAFVAEFAADMAPVIAAIKHLEAVSETNKALVEGQKAGHPMGVCACCFRAQKVQPNGKMHHHGYERPGCGYIVGGCPGSDFRPYSLTALKQGR